MRSSSHQMQKYDTIKLYDGRSQPCNCRSIINLLSKQKCKVNTTNLAFNYRLDMHPNSYCEVIHAYATRAPSWAPRAKSCDNWSADPIYYSCGAEKLVTARLGISMQQTTAITMITIIIREIWICTIKRSQS